MASVRSDHCGRRARPGRHTLRSQPAGSGRRGPQPSLADTGLVHNQPGLGRAHALITTSGVKAGTCPGHNQPGTGRAHAPATTSRGQSGHTPRSQPAGDRPGTRPDHNQLGSGQHTVRSQPAGAEPGHAWTRPARSRRADTSELPRQGVEHPGGFGLSDAFRTRGQSKLLLRFRSGRAAFAADGRGRVRYLREDRRARVHWSPTAADP